MRRDDIDDIDFDAYRVGSDDPRIKQGKSEVEAKLLTIEQKIETIEQKIEQLQREMCLLVGEKQSLHYEKKRVRRNLQAL